MTAHPDFSVVIVSHNEGDHLRQTVQNFRANQQANAEIIVVDDASSDGSADGLARDGAIDGVRVIRTPSQLGIAPARNLGAQSAQGDVLVFSDAHVKPPDGWYEPLRAVLEQPQVGAVGPAISVMGQPESKGYGLRWCDAALNVEWLGWPGTVPCPVPMLPGSFLALRRDVFTAVGGFDGGLLRRSMEDTELCLRLWLYGYECWLLPDVVVAHRFRDHAQDELPHDILLHNLLRVGIAHFEEQRLQRLIACLVRNPACSAAIGQLVASDVWQRRRQLFSSRRYTDSWFFNRFNMPV